MSRSFFTISFFGRFVKRIRAVPGVSRVGFYARGIDKEKTKRYNMKIVRTLPETGDRAAFIIKEASGERPRSAGGE